MDMTTELSIIDFMVYPKGTTMFLKSVDASNYIKDHKYKWAFEDYYQKSQ